MGILEGTELFGDDQQVSAQDLDVIADGSLEVLPLKDRLVPERRSGHLGQGSPGEIKQHRR